MKPRWAEVPLGQLCTIQSGSSNTQDAVEGGQYAFFDRSKKPKRSNRFLFDCEALIIAGEGAEFLPKRYRGRFDLHQRAYAIHGFGNKVLGDYLYYYLHHVHEYFQKVAVGATVKSLRQRHFDDLPVLLPPVDEQRRIVAILDEAFAGIATATVNAEKNLANARELSDQAIGDILSAAVHGAREVKLSEVSAITSKLVDPRDEQYTDLPHVGAGNIKSRTGELVDVKTAREEGLISGKFPFDQSTVLYSKIRPYLMKVCRPTFVGLCSADMYPLTPADEQLDRDYLYHLLLSREFTAFAEAGSARAGMPKVNRNHLFSYVFKLPTIESQRRAARRIDDLIEAQSRYRDVLTKKLNALAELKTALLQSAFSGEMTSDDQAVAA